MLLDPNPSTRTLDPEPCTNASGECEMTGKLVRLLLQGKIDIDGHGSALRLAPGQDSLEERTETMSALVRELVEDGVIPLRWCPVCTPLSRKPESRNLIPETWSRGPRRHGLGRVPLCRGVGLRRLISQRCETPAEPAGLLRPAFIGE